ncbi:MAG: hypothetical protein LBV00_11510 [Propionibacteriaceae bacterium]|jgi:predicted HTH transcriptional regulator|nr:hypothetical protein [Propionibacteriaceae bacterium]
MFPPLSLALEEVKVGGKLVLSVYMPPHCQPVRFKSRTFDRAEDGDVNITNNAHLMAALYQRKSSQHTERRVLPFADLSELRLAELMPTVRQGAVNKRPGHPWATMEDWDILRSTGPREHDPISGAQGINMAGLRDHIGFEVVSNPMSHQEFASPMPASLTIEQDRLVTENWNRHLRPGPIDPGNLKPDPKNPPIASFFVNATLADTLDSGVRNLYRYTRLYSGQDPQLIEGDVCTTVIPLGRSVT